MAAVVVENVTTVVITFFTHVFLFLPHTQKQDTGKPDIPFLLIFISMKNYQIILPGYILWLSESLHREQLRLQHLLQCCEKVR